MFTGIITDRGTVLRVEAREKLRRITIGCHYDPEGIAIGASIACSGPCLTVVERGGRAGDAWFAVDAAAETLARTTAGTWREGTQLNLERALRIGDELGGHLVTGHVDGTAIVTAREAVTEGEAAWASTRFWLEAPPRLARFLAEKGSVALDGVSLTINVVAGARFSVLLIPHTLAVTTIGAWVPGDAVNLEVDLMARYAARLAEAAPGVASRPLAAPAPSP